MTSHEEWPQDSTVPCKIAGCYYLDGSVLPESDMTPNAGAAFPTVEELAAWLPQYEISYCLFTGTLSAIYVGRQPALERQVMIRVMPEPAPELVPLLLDRLRMRARLVHPKIVSVFDFGRTAVGPLYLVTEFVDGSLLDTLIRDKQITPKHAFQLATQLCDTLQVVHDQRVIHGALSAHTVLVTWDWQVKLTGIGMSETASGELSWLGDTPGSFDDDIQALGRVIHEMFCGELPVGGKVSRALPAGFARVIARCIDPEPSRRFAQPSEVRAALAEALRAEKQAAAGTAKPAATLAPGPAAQMPGARMTGPPVSAPPKAFPGQPPPRVTYEPPPRRSLFLRLDDLLWSVLRTSLHLVIFGGTLAVIAAFLLLKDKIVFEAQDDFEDEPEAVVEPPKKVSAPAPVMPTLRPVAPPAPPPAAAPDPVEALDAQYREAVQREAAAALEGTRLNDMPYLQRELQRLQREEPMPATDEPDLPASLKRLRDAYRQDRAKLEK